MSDGGVTDELRSFVAGALKVDRQRLAADVRLERDLGVTGDDAVEFLEAFAERFSVDISAFRVEHYFGGEGWPPLGTAASLLLVAALLALALSPAIGAVLLIAASVMCLLAWRARSPRRHELTLGDLARSIETGRLPATDRVAGDA